MEHVSNIYKYLKLKKCSCLKGSLGASLRGVSCDLKVAGSSGKIDHCKQVRPPIIHLPGCGPCPNPAYAGCFVHQVGRKNAVAKYAMSRGF